MSHTPGPWIVFADSPPAIRAPDGSNIAPEVCHIADARLIAAAPDLLVALRVILRDYDAVHGDGDLEMQPALLQAQFAIEMAVGGTK